MCVWNLVICGSLSLVTFEAKLSCQSHCCRGTEDVTGTMAAVCVCVCAYIMYALLCICITRATVCMCVWGNMLPGRVTLRGWGPSEQFLSSSSPVDTGSVAVIAKCCCCSRCVGTAWNHGSWCIFHGAAICAQAVCVCAYFPSTCCFMYSLMVIQSILLSQPFIPLFLSLSSSSFSSSLALSLLLCLLWSMSDWLSVPLSLPRCCLWVQMCCQSTSSRHRASTSGQCCTTAPSRRCGTGSSCCWSSTPPSWHPTQLLSSSMTRWGLIWE